MPAVLIGLLLALSVSGGVAVAAEHTNPGDALYPVKVHVNDEVHAFIDSSHDAAVEANADAEASVHSAISGLLKIRGSQESGADAPAEAEARSNATVEAEGSAGADTDASSSTSVHTDVGLGISL